MSVWPPSTGAAVKGIRKQGKTLHFTSVSALTEASLAFNEKGLQGQGVLAGEGPGDKVRSRT